ALMTRFSAAPSELARSAWISCSMAAVPASGRTVRIRSSESRSDKGLVRGAGLEGEGMERPTHVALQGGINALVLLYPRLAAELLRYDGGGIVVTVPRKVADADLCIVQSSLDPAFDLAGIHGHGSCSSIRAG